MPKKHALCSVEELLRMLEARAKVRGPELEKGLRSRSNAQVTIMAKLLIEILRRGDSGRQGILELLNSDNPHVRSWAAFLALEFDPATAEHVLQEISDNYQRGLRSEARITLAQWRKGQLKPIGQWSFKDSKIT